MSTESEGKEMGDASLCKILISSSDLIFLQRARRDGVRAAHQADTIAHNFGRLLDFPSIEAQRGASVFVGQSQFYTLQT